MLFSLVIRIIYSAKLNKQFTQEIVSYRVQDKTAVLSLKDDSWVELGLTIIRYQGSWLDY